MRDWESAAVTFHALRAPLMFLCFLQYYCRAVQSAEMSCSVFACLHALYTGVNMLL
jgi:hypothetical protein